MLLIDAGRKLGRKHMQSGCITCKFIPVRLHSTDKLQVNKLSAVMQWPCAIELPSEFTSFISHQRPPTNLTSVVNCRRLLNAEIVCLFVFLNN